MVVVLVELMVEEGGGGFMDTVMEPETGTKNTATYLRSQNSKPESPYYRVWTPMNMRNKETKNIPTTLFLGATISFLLLQEIRLGGKYWLKTFYLNHLALDQYYRSTDLWLKFIFVQTREEREVT